MRAYRASGEEALHLRDLLKDWTGEGFLTAQQFQLLDKETACDLRRTNIFLRLVLFLFTLIIVGAAIGLFYVLFLDGSSDQTNSVFLLIFAALSYAAAELAVSRFRLYRHGIEEALAVCAVGLLCAGIAVASNSGSDLVIPAVGAIASIWIWHRFGLPYAALAAMLFAFFLPRQWTPSYPAQHLTIAAIYAAALFIVAAIRRPHRFTYLNTHYSIAEALLWLGIYVVINIQLTSEYTATTEFSRPFFWTAWALTWCLPPVMLARGVRQKDRWVIAVGALAAVLTLATNKSYLGWQRHSWDPMLLGALLISVALVLRRWLAQGPDEIRRGFTAQRLSGKDKTWLNAGTTAIGVASPALATPAPQPSSPNIELGGGASGGGGASSGF